MNAKQRRQTMLSPLFFMLTLACGTDLTGPQMGPGPMDIDVDPQTYTASAEFSYKVPLAGQRAVRLKGINGTVHFRGSDHAGEMMVEGHRGVGSDNMEDAQSHLAGLQVRITKSADEILIETRQPLNDGRDYEVDYEVTVPRGMEAYVENTNGQVSLEALAADARVQLVNGKIVADLTLPDSGMVILSTVNGEIDLKVQKDASAHFEATLTHGEISASDLDLKDRVQTPRSLTGRLGDGAGEIRLSLVNGDIRAASR